MREAVRKALQLCLIAVVSFVLSFGIGVFLARVLGVSGFKSYSVAIATVALLASFTTLGLEKYAMRVLPAYFESRDWSHASGFMTFGRSVLLKVSLGVILAFGLISTARALAAGREPAWPTLLAVLFLPVVVWASFLLEIVSASGKVVRAMIVYRLVLPVCAFLPLVAFWVSPFELTPTWAVASYGSAWAVSFLLFRRLANRSLPREVQDVDGVVEPRSWLQHAAPLLVHSVMMTQFASLGLVGLALLGSAEQEVALLAAAMQTGTLVVLLATATNRLYSPMVSRLIERRDYEGLIALIRQRLSWIVPAGLIFFVVLVIFGRRILVLFGPEYSQGYAALCWIAAGATVSVGFAMAPVYLKFVGKNSLVLGITAAAGAMNVVLLVLLGPEFGATGAAAAYGLSLGALAVAFLLLGLRAAKDLKAEKGEA